jgi:hypothetical protein
MRFCNYRSILWQILILAALLTVSPGHNRRLSAQYFPNTQAITYNPYGIGPYGNTVAGWGANARLNLGALPAAYSQQLPTAGQGYNFVRPFNNNMFGNGNYNQNLPNANYYNYNYSYAPYGYGS